MSARKKKRQVYLESEFVEESRQLFLRVRMEYGLGGWMDDDGGTKNGGPACERDKILASMLSHAETLCSVLADIT